MQLKMTGKEMHFPFYPTWAIQNCVFLKHVPKAGEAITGEAIPQHSNIANSNASVPSGIHGCRGNVP